MRYIFDCFILSPDLSFVYINESTPDCYFRYFSKAVDEIELFRVVNSSTSQSLIDIWADLGTIDVDSTDMTGSLRMRKIPNPHFVRDSLRKQYTLARQKKGTVVLESLSGQV